MHEKLLTAEEAEYALEMQDMFIVVPQEVLALQGNRAIYSGAKKTGVKEYNYKDQIKLTSQEIMKMLERMRMEKI